MSSALPARRPGDNPALAQAHPTLKMSDCLGEGGVPDFGVSAFGGGAVKIALNRQSPPQLGDRGACGVGAKRGDVGWPAPPKPRRSPRNARPPWRWRRRCRAPKVGVGSLEIAVSSGGGGGASFFFGLGAAAATAGTGAAARHSEAAGAAGRRTRNRRRSRGHFGRQLRHEGRQIVRERARRRRSAPRLLPARHSQSTPICQAPSQPTLSRRKFPAGGY